MFSVILPCVYFSPSFSFCPPLRATVDNPESITTAHRNPLWVFSLPVWSHHPARRLPSFLGPLAACLMSRPINPLVCGSLLPCHLVTGHFRFNTSPPGSPLGHRMSAPAIGIGHPVSAPVTPPSCAPHVRPGSSRNLFRDHARSWCGIPDSPYAIRISEFRIPESGIGVQGFLHAMKDYHLTRWIMVR